MRGAWVAGLAVALVGCGPLGEARVPVQEEARAAMMRPTFDADELDHIDAGGSVTRELVFHHEDGKYIGAISAGVVYATPEQALQVMLDVDAVPQWLPFNHKAEIVARRGDELVVEVLQGVHPFFATLSVRVQPDDGVIRIALDEDRPHDIEDVWGFIAARPYDGHRALVTTGIAVDVGGGALRLIEKEVQSTFPWIIDDVRSYIDANAHDAEHSPGCAERSVAARGLGLHAAAVRR